MMGIGELVDDDAAGVAMMIMRWVRLDRRARQSYEESGETVCEVERNLSLSINTVRRLKV